MSEPTETTTKSNNQMAIQNSPAQGAKTSDLDVNGDIMDVPATVDVPLEADPVVVAEANAEKALVDAKAADAKAVAEAMAAAEKKAAADAKLAAEKKAAEATAAAEKKAAEAKAAAEKKAAEEAKAIAEKAAAAAKAEAEKAEAAKAEAAKAEAEKAAAAKAEAEKAEAAKAAAAKAAAAKKAAEAKAAAIMHNVVSVSVEHQDACIGMFEHNGSSIIAACVKNPDNTCPVSFDASRCVELKPVTSKVSSAKATKF